VALARVAPLDAASTLVTDAGLGPDATAELEGRGLRVVVADVPAAEEEGSIS
jgi:DeoR/GlpR family transcriptional regulator of sugar metabolism